MKNKKEKKFPKFNRKSKGTIQREARRYIQKKSGQIELVYTK